MSAHILKKNAWFRCFGSFLPGIAVAGLLCFLLDGPHLGLLYDFLLRKRSSPQISRELLIIDSFVPGQELGDDILEPEAAASLLYTMTELGAEALIIQVPILGLSAGGVAGEAEILYRFDEEFSVLSNNIRNLFDAIRTGSVAPGDSARYVGELVELSEQGKERLVSTLVRRDEEGIDKMEKAAAFFGHVRRPGDLLVQLIRVGQGGAPEEILEGDSRLAFSDNLQAAPEDERKQDFSGILMEKNEYSRVWPDRDGVLRRIAPVLEVPGDRVFEHIIYGALKSRYESSEIRHTNHSGIKPGPVLVTRDGTIDHDRFIPLDRNGMVLFEVPHKGEDFRRIGISDFFAYDEADKNLRLLLAEGEALGIFQLINAENHPSFLYDYALALREELASYMLGSSPQDRDYEAMKITWIEGRNRYFSGLEEFLYGPTEMALVGGYENIIASESLGEAEIAKITQMRDALIRTFVVLRSRYNAILELRTKLESALDSSFCILGRGAGGSEYLRPTVGSQGSFFPGFSQVPEPMSSSSRNVPRAVAQSMRSTFNYSSPTNVEASALLANSILTGRVIKSAGTEFLLLGAFLCAFLAAFILKAMSPAPALGAGTLLTLLAAMGFSLSFILSGIWLDPLIPTAACGTAALVSFLWAFIARRRHARRYRQAFSPFVSTACLKSVIRAGRPAPFQAITVRAAVVAVKNFRLTETQRDTPGHYAKAVLDFHESAADLFTKAGGTITGTEGDMVTVCFGSPLERVFLGGKRKVSPYEDNIHALAAPALRASDIIPEILQRPECESWHVGLDLGDCTFTWTAVSGYFALGYPVQRARILARLASRYQARAIVSAAANEALPDLAMKKLGVLKESNKPEGDPFYRMSVEN